MTTPAPFLGETGRRTIGRRSIGLLALTMAAGCRDESGASGSRPDLYTVARGDLRITVREAGDLRALRETRIRSDVEGQSTLIFLVPEGTRVKQGDKLAELDASSLIDRRSNQRITVERAKAALVNAQQNVEILEKELLAEAASARSKLEIAQIALEKFLGRQPTLDGGQVEVPTEPAAARGTNQAMVDRLRELVQDTEFESLPAAALDLLERDNLQRDMGEMSQKVLDQIDKIRLARADLELKEDTLEHSRRLSTKNYITRNTLEQHQLDFDSQKSRVTLSWNELDLLISYQLKSQRIDLALQVDNAQLELDKTLASAAARRARESAELISQQSEYDLAKERLENLDRQIANATLLAPTPGLVVYAQVGDGRRNEIVEEGMTVRERQTLIILPDVTTMVAELKVPESDIDKIVVGQRAIVEVDAYLDQPFPGRVTRVAPLPDSGSRWTNSDKKVYKTEIQLDGVNTVLRPGMSSTVEVLVGVLRDTLIVPQPAVRMQGSVHYVWLDTPSGPQAQRVTIGRNNISHVEILEGIREGDRVYLSSPPDAKQPVYEQEKAGIAEGEGIPDAPPAPPAPPVDVPARPVEHGPAPAAAENGDSPQNGGQRPRGGGLGTFRDLVKTKLPQFAAQIDENPRGWFMDEAIQAAIEADPELKAASDEMRARMLQRRGEGGRGDGGPGGRTRGGDGPRADGEPGRRGGGEQAAPEHATGAGPAGERGGRDGG
jgi:HlyD family secretion protein